MAVTVKCDYCGVEKQVPFCVEQRQKNHFCTRRCKLKWLSENTSGENSKNWKQVTVKCIYCGKEKLVQPCRLKSKNNFCNNQCQAKWRLKERVTVYCSFCGKEKKVTKGEYKRNKNHFCDRECHSEWRIENPKKTSPRNVRVTVKCAWCGKEKKVTLSSMKRSKVHFCNRECQAKYKTKPVVINCAYCGKEKSIKLSLVREFNFCDNECRANWQTKATIVNCGWCGNEKTVPMCNYTRYTSHFCDSSCKINYFYGENCHLWRGGISGKGYCDAWKDEEYKESIRDRDDNKCQNPECWGSDDQIHIHHIDYDKENCHPENLITLCRSCNVRANTNREWHTKHYQSIMIKAGKSRGNVTTDQSKSIQNPPQET